jgi:putative CocE/NonD family hydrolase
MVLKIEKPRFNIIRVMIVLVFCCVPVKAPAALPSATYEFRIEQDWLRMRDGVRLSVTYYRPVPRADGEKFPVLLEMLPYRKDDFFRARDYSLYTYFVRHGYVMAKVDIRGTGSSEGHIPDREYSVEELEDAVETIRTLSRQPWSNGRVGMWGISWSGFNALQVAMRRPPGLYAILVAHANDDLYKDDVHYIDGALHVDLYALEIDHDNGMPASPDYRVDDAYIKSRFEAEPWILTYFRHQRDGDFWRSHSLRWRYDAIQVPVFMIGGLLDGYRDFIPRMLANSSVPMKAVIGPWNHSWPDDGVPGPNFEWRLEAVRWWDYWLKDMNTSILAEPRLSVFVRDGHEPDPQLQTTPGQWIGADWPLAGTEWRSFFPTKGGKLCETAFEPGIDRLPYRPATGIVLGYWWGEPTGDMREVEGSNLVYQGPVLEEKLQIAGFPRIHLRASVNASLAHWVARLEDVGPDGRVALVTGAVLNGSQRESRLEPKPLVPGEEYDLALDLHFTTWTFRSGHRIRLTVGNAAFPMIWPTPYPMTMQLRVGSDATRLELPVLRLKKFATPNYLPPESREELEGIEEISGSASGVLDKQQVVCDLTKRTICVTAEAEDLLRVKDLEIRTLSRTEYQTNELDPADSRFLGVREHQLKKVGRAFRFRTTIDIRSDRENFYIVFLRELMEDGRSALVKEWKEKIPRDLQ